MLSDLPRQYDIADIFADVLHELDPGFGRIDSVAFVERITPIFEAFESITRPRYYSLHQPGAKKSVMYDTYAFARGVTEPGMMGYRIVTLDAKKAMRIFDVDQLVEDMRLSGNKMTPEVRKKHFQSVLRTLEPKLKQTLGTRHTELARKLPKGITEVDDFGFMADGKTTAYKDMTTTCLLFADDMVRQLDDLTVENVGGVVRNNASLRKHLFIGIKNALERFIGNNDIFEVERLRYVHDQMDAEITKALAVNPSSRLLSNYNWVLYPEEDLRLGKDFSVGTLRRQIVTAFPIITLTDDYQSRKWSMDIVESMTYRVGGVDIDPAKFAAQMFGAKTKSRVTFYQNLTEKQIAPEVAKNLISLANLIAENKDAIALPKNRSDWKLVLDLWTASCVLARDLGRFSREVFAEMVTHNYPHRPRDMLIQHFNLGADDKLDYQRMHDIELWRQRIATVPLVHKLLARAKAEQLKLPVRHAFFIVAGPSHLIGNISQSMSRKLIDELRKLYAYEYRYDGVIDSGMVTGMRVPAQDLLKRIPITDILDIAQEFGRHRGQETQDLNREIYTRRMDSHPVEVVFPGNMPTIKLSFGYMAVPVRSQSELNTLCRRLRSPTVFDGIDTVTGLSHFIALNHRGGQLRALAKIGEPEEPGGAWRIEAPIEAMRGANVNDDQFDDLMKEYFSSPILAHVYDRKAMQKERENLEAMLGRRAPELALTLVDPLFPEETSAYLDRHTRYMPNGRTVDFDENGCLSTPEADAWIERIIPVIRPYYGGGSGAKVAMP